MIKFDTTREEAKTISRIVGRAMVMAKKFGVAYSPLDCDMDLTACHLNGNFLDLERLESFPDFDFSHDVFGIRKHLNRNTGALEDCFSPRSSTPHRFARKIETAASSNGKTPGRVDRLKMTRTKAGSIPAAATT